MVKPSSKIFLSLEAKNSLGTHGIYWSDFLIYALPTITQILPPLPDLYSAKLSLQITSQESSQR